MKVAKFFALLFALCGIVLMLGTTVLAFACLDRPVHILENPDNALRCSEELQQHLNSGDLAAAAGLMYGQPSFTEEMAPQDAYTAMIWEAFCDSISFTYTGNLYLLDAELARDGVVTVMDVAAVMDEVQAKAQALLIQQTAADGAADKTVTEQMIRQVLQQVLEGDPACISRNVTIRVIRRNDGWWILPDQEFLQAITGFGT